MWRYIMTTTYNAALKSLLLAILLGLGSGGCMQIVKTDMDTYLEDKK